MTMDAKPKWQPISELPLVGYLIRELLASAEEQYESLLAVRPMPHVLDDFTVNRVLRLYREEKEEFWIYEQQLARWRKKPLTAGQREEIDHLARMLERAKPMIDSVLSLAEELSHGTIDKVMAKSDLEVGLEAIMGMLNGDGTKEPPGPRKASRSPPGRAPVRLPPKAPEPIESKVIPLLPRLTANRQFIHDFISAETPCFALGLVEERKRQRGFLALRPDRIIPPEITNAGFRFGHTLFGNADFEVVHFAFEFYGFNTYNVLVNPNNPLVKAVLTTMVESGDYFFFELSSNGSATAFRSEIGEENLAGLKTNLPRIQRSVTTDAQYRKAVSDFQRNPEPPGVMLHWVCRDNAEYLDLTRDRLDLTPV
jgi:hypothetical protein